MNDIDILLSAFHEAKLKMYEIELSRELPEYVNKNIDFSNKIIDNILEWHEKFFHHVTGKSKIFENSIDEIIKALFIKMMDEVDDIDIGDLSEDELKCYKFLMFFNISAMFLDRINKNMDSLILR